MDSLLGIKSIIGLWLVLPGQCVTIVSNYFFIRGKSNDKAPSGFPFLFTCDPAKHAGPNPNSLPVSNKSSQ